MNSREQIPKSISNKSLQSKRCSLFSATLKIFSYNKIYFVNIYEANIKVILSRQNSAEPISWLFTDIYMTLTDNNS